MLPAAETQKLTQELIFNLHGIGTPHNDISPGESPFWVTRELFVSLLDQILVASTNPNLSITITFDDGNMSDACIALPELSKRGLKAAFFVCARRIGTANYLDQRSCADLLAEGMEIGTHGMDHRDWRTLNDATLDVELGEARRRIEDICGATVTKAAIPFGSYNRHVLQRLRREQFECVYTSDRGLARPEAWIKPRNTMDCNWLEADIKCILGGKQSTGARLRHDAVMLYKSLRW